MNSAIGSFVDLYSKIHGPFVLSLCVFGISTNLVNIIVLTRRHMIGPTNILLTGLSSAQLLLLINYFAYSIYHILDRPCNRSTKTYEWLAYLLFNVNVNLILHTIGLVHTTLLAVFRYAAVAFPTRCKRVVSIQGARNAVISAFLGVPIVCATFYPNSIIVEKNMTNLDFSNCPNWVWTDGQAESSIPIYSLRYNERDWLRDYNFWFFGTICKLLPCFLLVVLSGCLIRELSRVRRRRERLIKPQLRQISKSERHHGQITIMLVCIVLLFVVVELPQGMMNMLSAILKDWFINIYINLGDFFEMLTVLYSSINFILYCSMSGQFRATFKILFVAPTLRFFGLGSRADSLLSRSNEDRRLSKVTLGTDNLQTVDYPTTTALLDTAV